MVNVCSTVTGCVFKKRLFLMNNFLFRTGTWHLKLISLSLSPQKEKKKDKTATERNNTI